MTKVSITETYAVGCADCEEQLQRLCRWSARDSQITGLTFRAVERCDHALPTIKAGKPMKLPAAEALKQSASFPNQTTPTPPPSGELFAMGQNSASGVAGTGYDEPNAN